MRRRRKWSRWLPKLTAFWLWLSLGIFGVTGLGCGYAAMEIRHEQELRISSRRVRQAENQLRQKEIQWRLARQQNHELHAQLSESQAMLAMERARLDRSPGFLLAGHQ